MSRKNSGHSQRSSAWPSRRPFWLTVREEAVEAIARALHWHQYGTSVRLTGEAFDRSREKADLAVSTMQALGWHHG